MESRWIGLGLAVAAAAGGYAWRERHAVLSLDTVVDPSISLAGVEAPARLLTRRPDVARAEAQLAAQDSDVDAARAALLPKLRLDASIAFQSVFLSTDYDGNSIVYNGMVSLNQPILDGGERRGQRVAALALKLEAETEYRRVVITAVSDVERDLRAIDSLEKQLVQQRIAVDESRRAFALIESEYKAGAEELLSVLDAQRTLITVEDDSSQMRLAKLRASVALVKALVAAGPRRIDHGLERLSACTNRHGRRAPNRSRKVRNRASRPVSRGHSSGRSAFENRRVGRSRASTVRPV